MIWREHYNHPAAWDTSFNLLSVPDMLLARAEEMPLAQLIDFMGRKYSYADVASAARRVAKGLLARGMRKGDRVGLFLPNVPHYVAAYYGAMMMGAIVVNSCGGHEARAALKHRAADAHRDGRRILIFPEGALANIGEKYRYRSGVWHLYRDFDMPVVPLATNLGLFWPQEKFEKHPGTATLEFLEPIPTGLPKDEFLVRLEAAVEARTAELIAEATGNPVTPAVRVLAPDELDLAIDGPGFFQVARPDGTIMYTRNGSFKRDNVGNLVTGDGDQLTPVITIPSGALKIDIGQDGTVSVLLPGVTQASQVGQIQLVRFDNPSGLVSMGNNLFLDSFASGPALQGTGGFSTGFGTLQQGFLESSNVNLAEEMVNMIIAQRSYEINSKTIQASDEMMQVANNLRR